jgi:hypothetical protein
VASDVTREMAEQRKIKTKQNKTKQNKGRGAYFFIDSVSRAKTVGMSAASILRMGNTGLSGSFN